LCRIYSISRFFSEGYFFDYCGAKLEETVEKLYNHAEMKAMQQSTIPFCIENLSIVTPKYCVGK